MNQEQRDKIQQAIWAAMSRGDSERDEQILGRIEALLRDTLGQKHAVRQWRIGEKTP